MTSKIHRFGDLIVCTDLEPDGAYTAIDAENHDLGMPVGWGKTREAAIAELLEELEERRLAWEAAEEGAST